MRAKVTALLFADVVALVLAVACATAQQPEASPIIPVLNTKTLPLTVPNPTKEPLDLDGDSLSVYASQLIYLPEGIIPEEEISFLQEVASAFPPPSRPIYHYKREGPYNTAYIALKQEIFFQREQEFLQGVWQTVI